MSQDRPRTASDFLRANPANRNRGTERGRGLIKHSLKTTRFGRSLLAAADGSIIAGNNTYRSLQEAIEAGEVELGEPIIVRSDGTRPVIHVREDVATADSPQGRIMAALDNRTAQVNQNIDLAGVKEDVESCGATPEEVGYEPEELVVEDVTERAEVQQGDPRGKLYTPAVQDGSGVTPEPTDAPASQRDAAATPSMRDDPEDLKTYQLVVTCDDEQDQRALFNRLRSEGRSVSLQVI